jgi:hypothetical protein
VTRIDWFAALAASSSFAAASPADAAATPEDTSPGDTRAFDFAGDGSAGVPRKARSRSSMESSSGRKARSSTCGTSVPTVLSG